MAFDKNVFINCPFDGAYDKLLKPLIFTLLYIGYEPQISTTRSSSHYRIEEIMVLIESSKYSIHDISRCEPLNEGDLPRFNMPYEMGLDIGCMRFGDENMKTKLCLIIEKEKNRYDKVISDISGQDIKEHGDDPRKLIAKVLEWFDHILQDHLPGAKKIWDKYNECYADVRLELINEGRTNREISSLSPAAFIKAIKPWIANNV
jgi:hypothetical protein